MSTTDEKFQIEIDESTTISRGDMVEHIDHGPMHVERISVGPNYKRAQLQSELDATGLQLSIEEIREQWGETLHIDPVKLHEENPTVELSGIHLPDSGFSVQADLKVRGEEDMDDVETVAMYAKDHIVRAMQALDQGEHPEDVDGIGVEFHWHRILGEEEADG